MEVQFLGNVEEHDFTDVIVDRLGEIVDSTVERIMAENDGVVITGAVVTEATFTVGLHIVGIEEPQLVTVEHHKGHPEVFKWVIDLDEGVDVSNKDVSMFDSWSVSAANGDEQEFTEIESQYDPVALTFESEENFKDMDRVTLLHEDGFKVIKVYQHKHLVQEYKVTDIADIDVEKE